MKLINYRKGMNERLGIWVDHDIFPMEALNHHYKLDFPVTLQLLIEMERMKDLHKWFKEKSLKELKNHVPEAINESEVTFAPLYRQPPKIWGIGLNYVDHAADLHETAPNTEPASFMKPATTVIGMGDEIQIPPQSERTTGEAELGIVIGKRCKDVSEADALSVVAGFTTVIDMTAEDILEKNPRYLTRSKSFDTFFSFGPALLTPDEAGPIDDLEVSTLINGKLHRKNIVANMTFKPEMLISFHSQVMTLEPGDIISTGTPGAVHLKDGDTVRCEISGFPALENPVKDLKN
ncbi:2-keto-4-pentenoate hydratase/2-oxohepta-3-ene-1,7-dioic acid hydratase in catechol pathway [Geomicrobium halophilum]|uniref:2-keto-4-pentenoate hydratase/2-oxohepta-3-ene-1,7-dioic acid hydratase in catechol pathway n=1 Tax=Geomicrobium halophilum TaxID=549000 RepID=A0A841PS94_9BACL|nr:fumarylacetoacetate hydrolase family protein [Geomicrobium halophilum]MBB6449161.1 2-keto-4-pentenoate hydratase/2-oxohepta-3-ene-1,7-dioic acid hydratase in catechol pathway [Geomicrobium halophilum]